ncbi:MAG TPA: nicotinate phosphoribosyltransferase, partial [Deltaproteobacteria bacterium]|nr:nicotinate phosphoribosyltransferase [Deltaproteobacteria bacterium]
MKKLHIANTEEVIRGDVTDVYFIRTESILKNTHQAKNVCMEIFLKSFPAAEYR